LEQVAVQTQYRHAHIHITLDCWNCFCELCKNVLCGAHPSVTIGLPSHCLYCRFDDDVISITHLVLHIFHQMNASIDQRGWLQYLVELSSQEHW